jgi:hypothetical protein
MKKNFFYLALILLFSSCNKLCRDDDFSFSRTENNSNKLKLGGYYYGKITNSNSYLTYYDMLFQNGVVLCGSDSLKKVLDNKIEINPNEYNYKSKFFWGVYRIIDDSIEIQRWIPLFGGCFNVEAFKGVILNDTTFVLTKWYNVDKEGSYNYKTIYSIWKFKKYSPKPDSVVTFIP